MLGYSEKEMLSIKTEQIHPPEALPKAIEHFETVKRGGRPRNEDFPFCRKDGSIIYVDVTSSPIRYNQRPCWISFFHDVTERQRAQEALERERQSLWHMLQASDHERQIISYEIHDGLAQYLAAANMHLQMFNHLREGNPEEAKKAYDAAVQLVSQSHAEARRLISGVRPPVLDEAGLETALAHLVHDQRVFQGPKIKFDSNVQFRRLPLILENSLYRIAQEALTNACKHSKSEQVAVTLAQEGPEVRLEVRDWGIGFDRQAVQEGHFGLEGIRQRARLLGGRATIESEAGAGTLVQVVLPIVERPEDTSETAKGLAVPLRTPSFGSGR
jgi:signal transduction histidine kinase